MMLALAALVLGTAPSVSPVAGDVSLGNPIVVSPRIISGNIEHSDYPPAALRRGAQGMTRIGFIIRPEGTAFACKVVESSGHSDLDRRACLIVTTRTRFSPAIDVDGRPVQASVILPVHWLIGN